MSSKNLHNYAATHAVWWIRGIHHIMIRLRRMCDLLATEFMLLCWGVVPIIHFFSQNACEHYNSINQTSELWAVIKVQFSFFPISNVKIDHETFRRVKERFGLGSTSPHNGHMSAPLTTQVSLCRLSSAGLLWGRLFWKSLAASPCGHEPTAIII